MTDDEVRAIAARAERATPGPWEAWCGVGEDQAFVAHARTDVPALCAEVLRLREALRGAAGSEGPARLIGKLADDLAATRAERDEAQIARAAARSAAERWRELEAATIRRAEEAEAAGRALLAEVEALKNVEREYRSEIDEQNALSEERGQEGRIESPALNALDRLRKGTNDGT